MATSRLRGLLCLPETHSGTLHYKIYLSARQKLQMYSFLFHYVKRIKSPAKPTLFPKRKRETEIQICSSNFLSFSVQKCTQFYKGNGRFYSYTPFVSHSENETEDFVGLSGFRSQLFRYYPFAVRRRENIRVLVQKLCKVYYVKLHVTLQCLFYFHSKYQESRSSRFYY